MSDHSIRKKKDERREGRKLHSKLNNHDMKKTRRQRNV